MIIITIIITIIIIVNESLIVINNNAYIPILPISARRSRRAHISPDPTKKTGILPVQIVRNEDVFVVQKQS